MIFWKPSTDGSSQSRLCVGGQGRVGNVTVHIPRWSPLNPHLTFWATQQPRYYSDGTTANHTTTATATATAARGVNLWLLLLPSFSGGYVLCVLDNSDSKYQLDISDWDCSQRLLYLWDWGEDAGCWIFNISTATWDQNNVFYSSSEDDLQNV